MDAQACRVHTWWTRGNTPDALGERKCQPAVHSTGIVVNQVCTRRDCQEQGPVLTGLVADNPSATALATCREVMA